MVSPIVELAYVGHREAILDGMAHFINIHVRISGQLNSCKIRLKMPVPFGENNDLKSKKHLNRSIG